MADEMTKALKQRAVNSFMTCVLRYVWIKFLMVEELGEFIRIQIDKNRSASISIHRYPNEITYGLIPNSLNPFTPGGDNYNQFKYFPRLKYWKFMMADVVEALGQKRHMPDDVVEQKGIAMVREKMNRLLTAINVMEKRLNAMQMSQVMSFFIDVDNFDEVRISKNWNTDRILNSSLLDDVHQIFPWVSQPVHVTTEELTTDSERWNSNAQDGGKPKTSTTKKLTKPKPKSK